MSMPIAYTTVNMSEFDEAKGADFLQVIDATLLPLMEFQSYSTNAYLFISKQTYLELLPAACQYARRRNKEWRRSRRPGMPTYPKTY